MRVPSDLSKTNYFQMKLLNFHKIWLAGLSILAQVFLTKAQQSGQELYETFCSACHAIDQSRVGPKLQGVRKLWMDAGEGDLIYEWVKNPNGLKESGRSKRAAIAWDYSPSNMSPQPLTNEQIDAILDYADNWTAPPPPAPTVEHVEVTLIENYKANQTMFFWLMGAIVLLLIAIIVVAGSIKSFLQTDYFKSRIAGQLEKKRKDANKIAMIILLLISSSLIPAKAMAQDSGVGADEVLVKVTTDELYMVAIVVLILFAVLIYQVRLFKSLYRMTLTEEELSKSKKSLISTRKINKILTDSVDIQDESSILMDHEYDGIQELDNNLPPWWVSLMWGTIIFAVVYLLNYHVFKISPLQTEEYVAEVELAESLKDPNAVNENTAFLLTSESDLNAGKAVFGKFCVACHKEDGRGEIGPNLTDDYWIHGNDIKNLFKIVKYGSPNGKMTPHGNLLTPLQIQQVTSYVLSMPHVDGMPPQGEFMPKNGSVEEPQKMEQDQEEKPENRV
jgi:cytochrome c oxidase cbb3-type subunit 3